MKTVSVAFLTSPPTPKGARGGALTRVVLRQVGIEGLFLPSPTVGRGAGGEGYPSLLA
jgi:hypothetical protein